MNKNLIKDFTLNCSRHGEFKVSFAIYEKKKKIKFLISALNVLMKKRIVLKITHLLSGFKSKGEPNGNAIN